jgi:multidrug transporter EmrE-like cation transporter
MRTEKWAMGLVFLSTLSAAAGQILIKVGLNWMGPDFASRLGDFQYTLPIAGTIILGYGLYGLAAAVLVFSLKHGELSTLYPIYAMNFIWVAMLVPYIFPDSDHMNNLKWAGVILVVAGVASIGFGSKEGLHD